MKTTMRPSAFLSPPALRVFFSSSLSLELQRECGRAGITDDAANDNNEEQYVIPASHSATGALHSGLEPRWVFSFFLLDKRCRPNMGISRVADSLQRCRTGCKPMLKRRALSGQPQLQPHDMNMKAVGHVPVMCYKDCSARGRHMSA